MPARPDDHRPPVTIPEAAAYLHVSPRFVRRLVNQRRLPYLRLGSLIRLRPDDIDAYLEGALVEAE
jgi:excisionase family DNA binding protein